MLNRLLLTSADVISFVVNRMGYKNPLRSRSDLRLVFYHAIGERSSECLSYLDDETTLDNFVEQITYLKKNYRVLPLEKAIREVVLEEMIDGDPICSISFDDGLATVYKNAFPILKELGLSGTVFLNTAVIENQSLLWIHFLNYLLFHYGTEEISRLFLKFVMGIVEKPPCVEKNLINWAREHFKFIYEANALAKMADFLKIDISVVAREEKLYLDWGQIKIMAESGFKFYSHTANHIPLNLLSGERHFKREIEEARKCLINYNPSYGRFMSFPFGMKKDYGEEAKKYALRAGHEFIFEVGDGCNPLKRVKEEKTFSRVCLSGMNGEPAKLYSAIEIVPLLKCFVNRLRRPKISKS